MNQADSAPPVRAAVPRPAATLLVLREGAPGEPWQVLMVRRSHTASFMPGAYVFPGGALDPRDRLESVLHRVRGRSAGDLAAWMGGDAAPDVATAFALAAVRECFEESGVLLAVDEAGGDLRLDLASRRRGRDSLRGGVPVEDWPAWLSTQGAWLDLRRLEVLSRWVTPEVEPRRFDTVFFVAWVKGGDEALHDDGETISSMWTPPAEVLAQHARGEVVLPPPTLRNLEDIACQPGPEAVLRMARTRPRRITRPRLVDDDGTWTLVLPGDPLHDEREGLGGPTRIALREGRWTSESVRPWAPEPAVEE